MKIIDEKIVPCARCNPDAKPEFDLGKWIWCDDCRGHGYILMRTVQLDKPINMISIDLDFGFDI